MIDVRFAVNVSPKPGILDPQGRAVEGSLGHLGIEGVSAVRVGRRIELTVAAEENAKALNAAALFELDDVIDPAETRGLIASTLRAADQGAREHGTRFVDAW